MIDKIFRKTKKGILSVLHEEDIDCLDEFLINEPLMVKITRASKVKSRAYKELCCYKGSCKYIANMNFNEDMNKTNKVDHLTKIRCGFFEDVVYDENSKRTHWLVKSLSYANCDQPESHRFISAALEMHAGLVGISDVNDYVQLLRDQK